MGLQHDLRVAAPLLDPFRQDAGRIELADLHVECVFKLLLLGIQVPAIHERKKDPVLRCGRQLLRRGRREGDFLEFQVGRELMRLHHAERIEERHADAARIQVREQEPADWGTGADERWGSSSNRR